jgi:Zn-dependent M16 (insulinase) family peptidase
MDKYKDFTITGSENIEELQAKLIELTHNETGAKILHIQNEDSENVFSLSFKTLPTSSNGVAHILEHTVLCGSKKYPVKDPFFSMHRRSLNTYMNALTGSDFTCYPAATLVKKDFYNLLDVYLDAVFHPKLDELSFLQEGHRLEFQDPKDATSPLLFKGIVYNEMKGSLASCDTRLWKQMMHELYPTLSYRFNSGGDPEEIPNLTYQELLDFHKTYYHPSHCLFYFYGNIPLDEHLDFLRDKVFKGVKKALPLSQTPLEERFTAPKKCIAYYPIAEEEEKEEKNDKEMVAIGYLTCSIKEQDLWLALQVIDLILMSTDASPLKEALLKSGLCKQADTYIDSDATELPFVLIAKGCSQNATEEIEKVVLNALQSIVERGIDKEQIDAAIHQIEFSRSEITGSHNPFGLSLFMRSALLKLHGVNPSEGLKIHTLFDQLRKRCEDPSYLPFLIKKFLIDNKHKVTLTMIPDEELAKKENQEEFNRLSSIRHNLQQKDIENIIEKSKNLQDLQEAIENCDIEVLPKVSIEDVSKNARILDLLKEDIDGLSVYRHPCFTNHITYLDLHFDLPSLELDELPYLRLFSGILTEVGSGGRDYKQNLEYMQKYTGGLGAFVALHVQSDDFNKFRPTFGLKAKALYRNTDKLFSLVNDTLKTLDFSDKDRIKELLIQHHSNLEHYITQNAIKYATNLSSKHFSLPAYIGNTVYGLDYLIALRKIVKDFEKNPKKLIDKLYLLKDRLLATQNAQLVMSLSQDKYEEIKKEGFYGLPSLCKTPIDSHFSPKLAQTKGITEGRIIASPVAFTAMSLPCISFQHKAAASLNIASHLFENKVLHKRIREQGGAYGAGASAHFLSGHFTFYSYRDPHLAKSYKAFLESINTIAEGQFTDNDIEEAKLQIMQDLDTPIAPGQRASTAFSWMLTKKSYDVRNTFRNNLIHAKKEEIIETTKNHIQKHINELQLVSFANKSFLEQEENALKTYGIEKLPIYPV